MLKLKSHRLNEVVTTFIHFFFFGNYFYGLCAVALSIEASLQQGFHLNPVTYYLVVFFITVLFYTKAYLSERIFGDENLRTLWYATHQALIRWSQYCFSFFCLIYFILFLLTDWNVVVDISIPEWILILVFPTVAFLYYGVDIKIYNRIILRNIGWLKPFIIGFVWAGMVTVYPVLFYTIIHESHFAITQYGFLLFIKNGMFITMLCVLFDIKDYATDSNQQLKTFVVKAGLRKTIFSFVIPLTCIGLGSFMLYGFLHHFHPVKIILNMIPFMLLIFFAYSLHKPKSIMYYLILIDGLMLVKAVCGSIAMIYF